MDGFLLGLQRYIGRPRHPVVRLTLIAAVTGIVAALRWQVDHGTNGFAFSPFFPVILVSAVLYGWRYGLWASAGSLGMVIWLYLEPDWFDRPLATRLPLLGIFVLIIAIILAVSEAVRRLLFETQRRARQVETWNAELHHRTVNLVQVLVNWIERGQVDSDPPTYYANLSGNLIAWTRSSGLLGRNIAAQWDLRELVALVLSPFPGERIRTEGPSVWISGDTARAAAMALHELATNATKYGALGTGAGSVLIDWRIEDGGNRRVLISWKETAPAAAPEGAHRTETGTGFGLRMLSALRDIEGLAYSSGADGVSCEFAIAASDGPVAGRGGATGPLSR